MALGYDAADDMQMEIEGIFGRRVAYMQADQQRLEYLLLSQFCEACIDRLVKSVDFLKKGA
ncbi:hypothetical protein RSM1_17690 [Methylobacterium radiotolerans]|nr:hypothetical protein RSM1_17690 [Methylobacterium radiotolerans]